MPSPVTGVLDILQKGGGFLRDPDLSFQSDGNDVFVPQRAIQKLDLVQGVTIRGEAEPGPKGLVLTSIATVCGVDRVAYQSRTSFQEMTAINPNERFRLGDGGNPSMRIVELMAPIARGTRGLIVAPPKTGKTQLLEDLAKAIYAETPDTRIVVLLIDERPEEVTHFRRQVPAEVLASSSDQSVESHVRLAELCMAQVRCEAECGHDVVILMDSLTRLGRAFNQHGTGSKRTLSGGLDARALEIPRKFFGMARNVENGGSVTVIATALIDTGSRMDDMIFEEFKGTGNSEIVLDRGLAESRVFPAINLRTSGTRRDDILFTEEELTAINLLRRRAIDAPPRPAMEGMLKLLEKWPTNAELLLSIKS